MYRIHPFLLPCIHWSVYVELCSGTPTELRPSLLPSTDLALGTLPSCFVGTLRGSSTRCEGRRGSREGSGSRALGQVLLLPVLGGATSSKRFVPVVYAIQEGRRAHGMQGSNRSLPTLPCLGHIYYIPIEVCSSCPINRSIGAAADVGCRNGAVLQLPKVQGSARVVTVSVFGSYACQAIRIRPRRRRFAFREPNLRADTSKSPSTNGWHLLRAASWKYYGSGLKLYLLDESRSALDDDQMRQTNAEEPNSSSKQSMIGYVLKQFP